MIKILLFESNTASSTAYDWLLEVSLCLLGWEVERVPGMAAQASAWCDVMAVWLYLSMSS